MSRIPVVIYDTSSILLQAKEKIPVQRQVVELVGLHIPVVVAATLHELSKIGAYREWKTRRASLIALELIRKRFSVYRTEPSAGSVDDVIVNVALSLSERGVPVYVATCDLGLRDALSSRGVKVLLFRESKRRFFLY